MALRIVSTLLSQWFSLKTRGHTSLIFLPNLTFSIVSQWPDILHWERRSEQMDHPNNSKLEKMNCWCFHFKMICFFVFFSGSIGSLLFQLWFHFFFLGGDAPNYAPNLCSWIHWVKPFPTNITCWNRGRPRPLCRGLGEVLYPGGGLLCPWHPQTGRVLQMSTVVSLYKWL